MQIHVIANIIKDMESTRDLLKLLNIINTILLIFSILEES